MVARVQFVGLDRVKLGVRGLERDISVSSPELRRLFRALGRESRDYVRKRISSQGAGTWPKLSKWTRARTGRRKALTTERPRVTFRVKPRRAEVVYAERSNEWNLTKHHKGFTTPGTKGKRVTVPLRNPAILKWDRPAISFRNSQDSVVPARNVWGFERDHQRIAAKQSVIWMNRVLKKRAR